ncbi:Na+/H+ antiporter subunit E [Marinimicrobium koreense]|uniref:Na+/H+ antiporter subunit E n=1 Tax=Marinimicrobium koreense TaxID=306545 RepID=UPI003F71E170
MSNTNVRKRRQRKWLPHPVLSGFMVILWLLLMNDLSGGNLVMGALLAWFIPYATQSFWVQSMKLHRPWVAARFIVTVLWDIIIANWIMARMILGSPQKLHPAFMTLPLELKEDFAITLLANTISLTPGTVSADLSADGTYLIIHTLHVDDPDEAVAEIKARYEAPLKEIFECSNP